MKSITELEAISSNPAMTTSDGRDSPPATPVSVGSARSNVIPESCDDAPITALRGGSSTEGAMATHKTEHCTGNHTPPAAQSDTTASRPLTCLAKARIRNWQLIRIDSAECSVQGLLECPQAVYVVNLIYDRETHLLRAWIVLRDACSFEQAQSIAHERSHVVRVRPRDGSSFLYLEATSLLIEASSAGRILSFLLDDFYTVLADVPASQTTPRAAEMQRIHS